MLYIIINFKSNKLKIKKKKNELKKLSIQIIERL